MRQPLTGFCTALQFLTRLPVPARTDFRQDDLAKSALFFPLIGLLIGAGGLAVHFVAARHVSPSVSTVLILIYLILITGALHEDALADAADAFGGGWSKDQVLTIMRDSRIGSYGAIAISLSLLARFILLTEIPPERFAGCFVAAQVLSRWTALPLSFFLPSARTDSGQGRLVAGQVSRLSLLAGTLLAAAIAIAALEYKILWALLTTLVVTAATGLYYRWRIDGITGDCLGATIQLAEIAVYLTGVPLH